MRQTLTLRLKRIKKPKFEKDLPELTCTCMQLDAIQTLTRRVQGLKTNQDCNIQIQLDKMYSQRLGKNLLNNLSANINTNEYQYKTLWKMRIQTLEKNYSNLKFRHITEYSIQSKEEYTVLHISINLEVIATKICNI